MRKLPKQDSHQNLSTHFHGLEKRAVRGVERVDFFCSGAWIRQPKQTWVCMAPQFYVYETPLGGSSSTSPISLCPQPLTSILVVLAFH